MGANIKRRDFLRAATGLGATVGFLANPAPALGRVHSQSGTEADFPQVQGLTTYVSQFVVDTKFSDIPPEVVELGKKSILDGLGLALSGSKAETAGLIQEYIKPLGLHPG